MPDELSVDLASERLGGSVLYATDDYFAEKENLLRPAKAVWKEHEYTDRGKWMDGWESRRKRTPGHDFAIIRLGLRGVVRGVVVDTAFFRGNYPAQCSIEGCSTRPESDVESLLSEATNWIEILPKSDLKGDSENLFAIDSPYAFTHLRLHIYPDGGVARLRVHGEVVPDWRREGGLVDRDGPRRGGARRRRAGVQRHVLRAEAQPDHAGPRGEHERRMGDEAAARAGTRLGHRAARRRGVRAAHRDRHQSLQGQLSRHLLDRRDARVCERRMVRGAGADETAGAHASHLHRRAGAERPGHASAAQRLSRRRREPAARAWRGHRGRPRRCRRAVCQHVDRRSGRGAVAQLLRIDRVGAADDGGASVSRRGAISFARPKRSGTA